MLFAVPNVYGRCARFARRLVVWLRGKFHIYWVRLRGIFEASIYKAGTIDCGFERLFLGQRLG